MIATRAVRCGLFLVGLLEVIFFQPADGAGTATVPSGYAASQHTRPLLLFSFLAALATLPTVEASLWGIGHGGHRIYWDSERALQDLQYSSPGGGLGFLDQLKWYVRYLIDEEKDTIDRGELYMYQLRTPTSGGHNCLMYTNWGEVNDPRLGGKYEALDQWELGVDGNQAKIWVSQYPECIVWTDNLEFLSDPGFVEHMNHDTEEKDPHNQGAAQPNNMPGLVMAAGAQKFGVKNNAQNNALMGAGMGLMSGETSLRHPIWIPSYVVGGAVGMANEKFANVASMGVSHKSAEFRMYTKLNMDRDGTVEIDESQAYIVKYDVRIQNITVGLCCGCICLFLLTAIGLAVFFIFCHVKREVRNKNARYLMEDDYYGEDDGYAAAAGEGGGWNNWQWWWDDPNARQDNYGGNYADAYAAGYDNYGGNAMMYGGGQHMQHNPIISGSAMEANMPGIISGTQSPSAIPTDGDTDGESGYNNSSSAKFQGSSSSKQRILDQLAALDAHENSQMESGLNVNSSSAKRSSSRKMNSSAGGQFSNARVPTVDSNAESGLESGSADYNDLPGGPDGNPPKQKRSWTPNAKNYGGDTPMSPWFATRSTGGRGAADNNRSDHNQIKTSGPLLPHGVAKAEFGQPGSGSPGKRKSGNKGSGNFLAYEHRVHLEGEQRASGTSGRRVKISSGSSSRGNQSGTSSAAGESDVAGAGAARASSSVKARNNVQGRSKQITKD
ncbi:unnamed protein product [Amoebophrya sp. A120]|nr:unnamed protein product [Amoebophrya sp. A120]|eukprot:GSA120T00019164001.1